jgi:hypothetical protein
MVTMTRESFEQELSTLPRQHPPGTAADLSDCMVAYWNGTSLVYAYLGAGVIEEEPEVDDSVWEEWRLKLKLDKWHASPTFSVRTELDRSQTAEPYPV